MSEEHEGIVIEVKDGVARVKASRHSDCENCGACPGDSAMVLDARNQIGVVAGQKVLVKITQTNMLKAAFIVYILPLIAAVAGAITGGAVATILLVDSLITGQIIGGILSFIASGYFIIHYDRQAKLIVDMQPVIIRKLSHQ